MAKAEMNFGPEWLRALQDGMPKTGSNSNSSSSSMSKISKLIKHTFC